MNNIRRWCVILCGIFMTWILYDLMFTASNSIAIPVETFQRKELLSSHWLIIDSTSQLRDYLKSPIASLSIIFDGAASYHSELNRKKIKFIDMKSEKRKYPFQSTDRKTIAYLLAIHHGARFIYEYHPNITLADNIQHIAFRRSRSLFVNIHPTFTANFSIYSPGLPQEEWTAITQDGWSSIRTLDQDRIHPMIQQQIRIHENDPSHYVNHPPVAVEPFTFAPFTNKDILFTYDAFWGLITHQTKSRIWRSWWVQRLLWDLEGHLVFASSYHKNELFETQYQKTDSRKDGNIVQFVNFLSRWSSTRATLIERIEELFIVMRKNHFSSSYELYIIRAWLRDLISIGYQFPDIKRVASTPKVRRRRVAVCLTGLIECIEEAWRPTAKAIRSHLAGDMDTFMYLSSTEPVVDQLSTIALRTRLIEALRYENFTVKVLFENIPKLDPQFPPNCTSDASVDQPPHKIPRYYQQLFGLANCFALVRDYEMRHNIKYDIMVRSRADIEFLRIPSTFERADPLNISKITILPPNRYSSVVDDGFAIGPIDQIEAYMNRYFAFRQCITRDLHPERFLHFYLSYRKVPLVIDQTVMVGHIPHGAGHCH